MKTPQIYHDASDFFCFRSADLLSGLVGLMAAGSMLPVDVESAATSLRAVLIGRTATIAANTLSDAAATARKASTGAEEAERTRTTGWPATAVGEALLLWMAGDGLMQVFVVRRCRSL